MRAPLELESVDDRCDTVLEDGRQGAAPVLPYDDAIAPKAAD